MNSSAVMMAVVVAGILAAAVVALVARVRGAGIHRPSAQVPATVRRQGQRRAHHQTLL